MAKCLLILIVKLEEDFREDVSKLYCLNVHILAERFEHILLKALLELLKKMWSINDTLQNVVEQLY